MLVCVYRLLNLNVLMKKGKVVNPIIFMILLL